MSNKAFVNRHVVRPSAGTRRQAIQEGLTDHTFDMEEREESFLRMEPPKADDSWQDDYYADLGEEWTDEAEKQPPIKVVVDLDNNVILDAERSLHQLEPVLG